MRKIVVVSANVDGWGSHIIAFNALDISLVPMDVGAYYKDGSIDVEQLKKDLTEVNYDFVVCDLPKVYPHLPPAYTLLVGGKFPAFGLLSFISALRSGKDVNFLIWTKTPTPISETVRQFLAEWGYPYSFPMVEESKVEKGKVNINIVCSREGYLAVPSSPLLIFLPNEQSAEALCNFLCTIFYDFVPPECRVKALEGANGDDEIDGRRRRWGKKKK